MEVFDAAAVVVRPDQRAALGRFCKLIEVRVSTPKLPQMLLPEIHKSGVRIDITNQPIDEALNDWVPTFGSKGFYGSVKSCLGIDGNTDGKFSVSAEL